MATVYSGIYGKIKDKTRTVEDRLKLTKFVWKSGRVFIPNKEQILIDFLCGLLVNKKKNNVTDQDVRLVWRCLHDILHTKQAHQPSKYGQTLIIKPSICQVLTDSLLVEYEKSCDSSLDFVIGCCHAILNSPALSYVFKTKYDTLVKLLTSVVHLCIRAVQDQSILLQSATSLLDICVKAYSNSQRSQPSQKLVLQAVSEKLLLPVLVLENLCESGSVHHSLSHCIKNIRDDLQQALFDKEHSTNYEKYLHSFYGPAETKSQPPKIIENIFTLFSNLLQRKKQNQTWKQTSPEKLQTVIVQYLPVFYTDYLSSKCYDKKSSTGYWMFLHLCSVIGLKQESAALCGPVGESDALSVLYRLLQIVHRADVYNQAEDSAADNVQLKFYRHVLDVLLTCNRTLGFYQCLESLLLLNHQILEPKMSDVLIYAWLNMSTMTADEEAGPASGSFMSALVRRYSKLRHIPKWVDYILNTIRNCSEIKVQDLDNMFSDVFGEVVESLPQTVVIDMWRKFVDEVKEHYIPQLFYTEDKVWTTRLTVVTSLITSYLSHVKLIDYQVTEMTFGKVEELMKTMETEVIVALLDISLEQRKNMDLLLCSLRLCLSWGDLHLLLVEHTKHEGSFMMMKPGKMEGSYPDMSYLHTKIPREKWAKVYTMLNSAKDKRIEYVMRQLSVQTFRAIVISKMAQSEEASQELLDVANTLLSAPLTCIEDYGEVMSWDNKVNNITNENYTTVMVEHVLSILPLCVTFLNEDTAQKLADLMVHRTLQKSKDKSLTNKPHSLCHSCCVRESRLLQSSVISSCFTLVKNAVFPRNIKSSKKKRSSPSMALAKEAFEMICDLEVKWAEDIDELKVQRLKGVSKKVGQIISAEDGEYSKDFSEQHLVCLQHLSALPLDYLTGMERIRCILGLLLMHSLVDINRTPSDCLPVQIKEGVQLITVMLETCGHTPIFQIINVELFLQWLSRLYRTCKMFGTAVLYNVQLLMEMSCRVIVTDSQALLSLGHYLDQLKLSVLSVQSSISEQELPPLMLAVYFMNNLDRISKRTGLREDVKVFAEKHLAQFSDKFDHTLKKFRKAELSAMSVLVQGYTAVLNSWQHQDTEIKPSQRLNLEYMTENIIRCLHEDKYDKYGEELMAYLNFLLTLCKCHRQYPDLLKAEHKQTLWEGLKNLLSNILLPNSTTATWASTEDSESSSLLRQLDSDVIRYLLGTSPKENMADMDKLCAAYVTDQESMEIDQENMFKTNQEKNWLALRQILKFEDRFETEKKTVTWILLQQVMGSFVASCDVVQFQDIVNKLIADTDTEHIVTGQATRLQSACYIWDQLIQYELSEEQGRIVVRGVHSLMLNYQAVMLQVKDMSDDSIISSIVIPILKSQTKMLEYGPILMSPQTAVGALHSCQYASLTGRYTVPVFHAVYDILNALLVYHTNATLDVIQNLLKCANQLMRSVIQEGKQEKLISNQQKTEEIIGCAQLMDRLYALISTHRAEFGRVASCIVADYVTEVQQVTLLPAVKRALVPAVYHILDICDKHAIAQLHTVLNLGVKEVFKVLYADYQKYHKYTGKV